MDYAPAAFAVSLAGIAIIVGDRLFRGGGRQAQTETRLEKLENRVKEAGEVIDGFRLAEQRFISLEARFAETVEFVKELRMRTHSLRNDLTGKLGNIEGNIEELRHILNEERETLKMVRSNLHGTKDVLSGLIMRVELDLRDHIAECRGRHGRRD